MEVAVEEFAMGRKGTNDDELLWVYFNRERLAEEEGRSGQMSFAMNSSQS